MIISVPLDRIEDNPWQTRQSLDTGRIVELAADIYRNGLMQNPAGRLVIRNGRYDGVPVEESFPLEPLTAGKWDSALRVQLAFGHNRVAAYRVLVARPDSETCETLPTLLGADPATFWDSHEFGRWLFIPIQIARYDDETMARLAWAENFQRKDLTAYEELLAIEKSMRDFGWTQAQAGQHFGISRSALSNKMRLRKLPADVLDSLHKGEISERQAAALLPAFSLPAPALETAQSGRNGRGWYIKDLLDQAAAGSSSDVLRNTAGQIVKAVTADLDSAPFPIGEQIADGNPDVRAARCTACEFRVKHGDKDRCGDVKCFGIKEESWRGLILGLAQQEMQRSYPGQSWDPLPPGEPLYYTETFYDEEAGKAIIVAAGCPKNNLRLYFQPDNTNGIRVGGQPDCRIVCAKGSGKQCTCLNKWRKERGGEQSVSAEDARKKEVTAAYKEQVFVPARDALVERLEKMDPAAWELVIRKQVYGLPDDWGKAVRKLAGEMLENAAGYYWGDWVDILKTQAKMQAYLAPAGIQPNYPALGQDTAEAQLAVIGQKLDRIVGWTQKLSQQAVTAAAIQGNLDNLATLGEQMETIYESGQGDGEKIEQLSQQIAGQQDLLETLLPFYTDQAVELLTGFDDVAWLTSTPPGDVNFKSHLKRASATALQFTLAIVRTHGDGHAVRIKTLEQRLNALQKQEVVA